MATLSANQIKFIRSLGQKKFRQESGLFIAEGEKIVNEALASEFKVRELYKTSEIGESVMERISCLNSPSPVLAVIEQRKELAFNKSLLLEQLKKSVSIPTDPDKQKSVAAKSVRKPLYLALDGVKDPGNLGTIIRLADWFGIDGIFASEDTVEMYNPKVVQATMGAIFRKPVTYANLHEVVDTFAESCLPVHGTFLDGKNMYEHTELPKYGLIVMGSESFGISKELESKITSKLFIPPYPADSQTSESLNVAIATAIICSFFRQ